MGREVGNAGVGEKPTFIGEVDRVESAVERITSRVEQLECKLAPYTAPATPECIAQDDLCADIPMTDRMGVAANRLCSLEYRLISMLDRVDL